MLLRKWLPLFVFLLPSLLYGTTWYVDNACPNNGDGTAQTCAASLGAAGPFNSIANVQSAITGDQHGNSVLLTKGTPLIYREQYTVPANGTSAGQFTVGNYGTGDIPIINGADIFSSWTAGTPITGVSPVGSWLLNEGSGITAIDSSGNSNGTWHGASSGTSGHYSPGYLQSWSGLYNGTDNYIRIPDAAAFDITGTAVTLTAWVNVTNYTSSGVANLIYKGDSTPSGYNPPYALTLDYSNNLYFQITNAAKTNVKTAMYSAAEGSWIFVAGVYDGAHVTLYINGAAYGSPVVQTGNIVATTEDICLGCEIEGGAVYNTVLNGLLERATIYNAALTAGQISVLYANGSIGTTWTPYYTPYTTAPQQVFEDGAPLTLNSSLSSPGPGQWTLDTGNNYIWVAPFAADSPASHTMEASQRTYGIEAVAKPYLTIQNLETKFCNQLNGSGGITLYDDPSNDTINGVVSDYNAAAGIKITDRTSANSISNVTVKNSQFFYNGQSGIDLGAYTGAPNSTVYTGVSFLNNVVHHNSQNPSNPYTAGIYFGTTAAATAYEVQSCLVQGNIAYLNGYNASGLAIANNASGSGIWPDTVQNCTIQFNQTYNNAMIGIFLENGQSNVVASNLSWGNISNVAALYDPSYSAGIAVGASRIDLIAQSNLIYNNTLYGNISGLSVSGYDIGSAYLTNTIKNNIFTNNIISGNTLNQLFVTNGADNTSSSYGYGSGNVYTFNALGTASSNFISWGQGANNPIHFSTYATWEAATGNCGTTGCSHSIETDPTFANAAGGQFWQTVGSSGIASGTSLGAPYNVGIQPGASWPYNVFTVTNANNDLGAFPYTETVIDSVTGSGTQASGTTR